MNDKMNNKMNDKIRVKMLNFYVSSTNQHYDDYYDTKYIYTLEDKTDWDEVSREDAVLLRQWTKDTSFKGDIRGGYHFYVLVTEEELSEKEPAPNIERYLELAKVADEVKRKRLDEYNALLAKQQAANEKRKKTKLLKQIAKLEEMKKEVGIK